MQTEQLDFSASSVCALLNCYHRRELYIPLRTKFLTLCGGLVLILLSPGEYLEQGPPSLTPCSLLVLILPLQGSIWSSDLPL